MANTILERQSEGGMFPVKLVPQHDRTTVTTLNAFLIFFAVLGVSLRFYTRIFILNNLGRDDIFCLLSLITFFCYIVLFNILGTDIVDRSVLTFNEMTTISNILLALEIFYVATMALFKLSLGYFFLRFLNLRIHRLIVNWIMIIFSICSIVYFFIAIFQCGPPQGNSLWTKKLEGKCIPDGLNLGVSYTHAILTAGSDLILLYLPFPMVANSTLRTKEKVVVVIVMVVGTMGCIASFVRIKWIPVLTNKTPSFFYDGVSFGVWSAIEPGLGIIASSFAIPRPLFRSLAISVRDSKYASALSSHVKSLSEKSKFGSMFSSTNKTTKFSTTGKSKQTNMSKSEQVTTRGVMLDLLSRGDPTIRAPSPAFSDRFFVITEGPGLEPQLHTSKPNMQLRPYTSDAFGNTYVLPLQDDPVAAAEAMLHGRMSQDGRRFMSAHVQHREGLPLGIYRNPNGEADAASVRSAAPSANTTGSGPDWTLPEMIEQPIWYDSSSSSDVNDGEKRPSTSA